MVSIIFTLVLSFCSVGQATMTFQKQVGDQRFIVVANNDGSEQRTISNPGTDTYHPEISSDGQYVAYSRGTIRPGKKVSVEMVIQNLQSSEIEVWTPKGNQYIHAEFSGNGRYLVYSGFNESNSKQNIQIIDLFKERKKGPYKTIKKDGVVTHLYKPEVKIIESTYDCYAPAVSSDGTVIIYHRTLDKSNKKAPKQLVKYETGKDLKTELTDKKNHAMFPTISSEDRYIAYVSKDNGQWDIYLYDLWKKTTSQVTNDSNMEFTPVFSADNSIYYTHFKQGKSNNSEIDIYYLPREQVFNEEVKIEKKKFLFEKNVAEYVPSFSNPSSIEITDAKEFLPPERSSFGAVTHNNKIYIAGGHQGPEHTYPKDSFLDKMEVYDIKTKQWSKLTPLAVPKHGFQMMGYGNYIYVFGGFTYSEKHLPAWKSLDRIERYDIKNDEWVTLPQKLSVPRSSNAIGRVGSLVYLIGGWNSTPKHKNDKEGKFLEKIEVFNLETEKIMDSSLRIPLPLRRAFSSVTINEKIYLLGGIGEGRSHFNWIDNLTVLDTKKNTWSELPSLPFPTFAPGVGQINGDLYLVGGLILKDKATYNMDYVDDIYKYDQKKKKWSHSGVYMSSNKGFPQVVPMGSASLGILGGHTYEFTKDGVIDHPVSSFEILKVLE